MLAAGSASARRATMDAMRAAREIEPARTVVVVGHGGEAVARVVQAEDEFATVVTQAEHLGTGHAVDQARAALDGAEGDVIVLYGDTPFIRAETLDAMLAARAQHDVLVLGFEFSIIL